MAKITNQPDPGAFHRLVWLIVRAVPAGQVTTYGQLAAMIPPPPDIHARGGISLPEDSRAARQQINRLKREDVVFEAKDQIDLAEFGWGGPDEAWCQAHALLPPPPFTDLGESITL